MEGRGGAGGIFGEIFLKAVEVVAVGVRFHETLDDFIGIVVEQWVASYLDALCVINKPTVGPGFVDFIEYGAARCSAK